MGEQLSLSSAPREMSQRPEISEEGGERPSLRESYELPPRAPGYPTARVRALMSRFEKATDGMRAALDAVFSEELEEALREKWKDAGGQEETEAAVLRDQWEFFHRFTTDCHCSRIIFASANHSNSFRGLRSALNRLIGHITYLELAVAIRLPRTENPRRDEFLEIFCLCCERFAARCREYDFSLRDHTGFKGEIPHFCCLYGFLVKSWMAAFSYLS